MDALLGKVPNCCPACACQDFSFIPVDGSYFVECENCSELTPCGNERHSSTDQSEFPPSPVTGACASVNRPQDLHFASGDSASYARIPYCRTCDHSGAECFNIGEGDASYIRQCKICDAVYTGDDLVEEEEEAETPICDQFRCCCGKTMDECVQRWEGNQCVLWQCSKCGEAFTTAGKIPDNCEMKKEEPGDILLAEPCGAKIMETGEVCDNDNPELFIIEQTKETKDFVLICGVCDNIKCTVQSNPKPQIDESLMFCRGCDISDTNFFQIECDDSGILTVFRCLNCHTNLDLNAQTTIICACGNRNIEQFRLKKNILGQLLEIKCRICKKKVGLFNDAHPLDAPDAGKGLTAAPARERIRSVKSLRPGDHIEFHRAWGYKHHAIVTESYEPTTGKLRIIHYSGELKNKTMAVIEEVDQEIDCSADPVYCIKYHIDDCFKPLEVIERARSRLGERKYGFLSHNCEHFARWAKTGQNTSFQVMEFLENGKQTFLQLGKFALAQATTRMGMSMAGNLFAGVAAEGAEAIAGKSGVTGFDALGAGLLLGLKVYQAGKKIHGAKKQLDSNQIKQDVFEESVVETVAGTSIDSLCSIGGYILGQYLIPVPVLGAVVGSTLGSILGHVAGMWGGRFAKQAYSEYRETAVKKND